MTTETRLPSDSERVHTLVMTMVEAWNARDMRRFYDCLAGDVTWHDPAMDEPAVGLDAVTAFCDTILKAFPDFQYIVSYPLCISDDATRCSVCWHIRATNLGRFDPPGYAPTGRPIYGDGVDVLEIRDGKVVSIQTYFDPLPVMEQLAGVRFRPPVKSWRGRMLILLQRCWAFVLKLRRADK